MKTLSFAFFVTLYLVFTHTNCGIESSYLHSAVQKEGTGNGGQNRSSGFDVLTVHVNQTLDLPLLGSKGNGEVCLGNVTQCIRSGKTSKKLFESQIETQKIRKLIFLVLVHKYITHAFLGNHCKNRKRTSKILEKWTKKQKIKKFES